MTLMLYLPSGWCHCLTYLVCCKCHPIWLSAFCILLQQTNSIRDWLIQVSSVIWRACEQSLPPRLLIVKAKEGTFIASEYRCWACWVLHWFPHDSHLLEQQPKPTCERSKLNWGILFLGSSFCANSCCTTRVFLAMLAILLWTWSFVAAADWMTTVNTAGFQRTLSQKMTKEFLLVARGIGTSSNKLKMTSFAPMHPRYRNPFRLSGTYGGLTKKSCWKMSTQSEMQIVGFTTKSLKISLCKHGRCWMPAIKWCRGSL